MCSKEIRIFLGKYSYDFLNLWRFKGPHWEYVLKREGTSQQTIHWIPMEGFEQISQKKKIQNFSSPKLF